MFGIAIFGASNPGRRPPTRSDRKCGMGIHCDTSMVAGPRPAIALQWRGIKARQLERFPDDDDGEEGEEEEEEEENEEDVAYREWKDKEERAYNEWQLARQGL